MPRARSRRSSSAALRVGLRSAPSICAAFAGSRSMSCSRQAQPSPRARPAAAGRRRGCCARACAAPRPGRRRAASAPPADRRGRGAPRSAATFRSTSPAWAARSRDQLLLRRVHRVVRRHRDRRARRARSPWCRTSATVIVGERSGSASGGQVATGRHLVADRAATRARGRRRRPRRAPARSAAARRRRRRSPASCSPNVASTSYGVARSP